MPNQSGVWTLSQQFQARGQGLWPAPPGAPTIGTASVVSATSASVTFTAPTCTGYPAGVTGYLVTSSPGCITATGASSPVTVTGLTACSTYTFKVKAQNSSGLYGACSAASNSIKMAVIGQQAYTTAGTYSWVAPAGVTSVSVVAVGGGGGGGYSPGSTAGGKGGTSYFNTCTTVTATGGSGGQGNGCYSCSGGGSGGTATYGTGFAGGKGGSGQFIACYDRQGYGGGAAGYTGNGGAGASYSFSPCYMLGGGGVGILGGSSGGNISGNGKGGSGGCNGVGGYTGTGGAYGGGGSGYASGGGGGGGGLAYKNNISVTPGASYTVVVGAQGANGGPGGKGAGGAVRIIWPGTTRQFPSTCTGNM